MNHKKFLGAASAALMIVIILTLVLAPEAWAASKSNTLYKFKFGKDGKQPYVGLISDAAGNLYGTTTQGGINEFGIVFKLTPNSNGSWTEKVLHRFSRTNGDGALPRARLTLDAAGNLYGTTVGGGVGSCVTEDYGCGTVFKLIPKPDGSWAEAVLYKFTGAADGAGPYADLIFDPAGNLYGTTTGAGNRFGTVFKLTPKPDGSWAESVLYTFCSLSNCADGGNSWSGLIFDQNGNLYGATASGGTFNRGTVFNLTPNADGSWTEHVLYSFTGDTDGQSPEGDLIFDQEGNLYGTTSGGAGEWNGGVVFQLTPNADGSWNESVLYRFCSQTNCNDGINPSAGLIFDSAGNLYGTTTGGGRTAGNVFELAPNANGSWTESVLYRFCQTDCNDGINPSAGLIFDKKGNLYSTALGGVYGDGVVFKLVPHPKKSWTESVLHAFSDTIGDGWPTAGLVLDAAGNLYGTTPQGGTGCGKVFKLAPNPHGTWAESVLYQFAGGMDGCQPYAGLIFDQSGNLYGTTLYGGNSACGFGGCGVVFKLTPNLGGSWTESVLYSFTGFTDGISPAASLIFDPAGNLYGTTERGGGNCYNQGCATVFKLAPNTDGSWTESVLYLFCSLKNCHDGGYPSFAGLVLDQPGNLYGTTPIGGYSGCGVVYKLAPNLDGSWTETAIHQFSCGKDGGNPVAGVIFDKAGNLYGTTQTGGTYGHGVAFKLTPSTNGSWTEKQIHHFTGGKDGGNPMASLIFDQVGNLYGTASGGGAAGYGVVFRLTPNSNGRWSETVLQAFTNHPGAYPVADLIFDAAGNLYGTTPGDGTTTHGSVFEITP